MQTKTLLESGPLASHPAAHRARARALVSVSDKSGLVSLAQRLLALQFELVATGSTRSEIAASGVSVRSIDEVTGFPEILGGRVKTLHPTVFGGILARPSLLSDRNDLEANGLVPVEVVVCNLYPFAQSAAQGKSLEELIEKIDIGGVSLLRAAAKNHAHVVVLCDPVDYDSVLQKMATGQLSLADRRQLALKALQMTAAYDALIASVLEERFLRLSGGEEAAQGSEGAAPLEGTASVEKTFVVLEKVSGLRYGENPHQAASLYRTAVPAAAAMDATAKPAFDLTRTEQLGGKELSYNNYLDVEHGLRLIAELPPHACVIVKHNMPCGVGFSGDVALDAAELAAQQSGSRSLIAFDRAFAADPVSPFGGVVLFNDPVDALAATRLAEIFLEIVSAPAFTPEALQILQQKKNLRLLVLDPLSGTLSPKQYTQIQGGFLLQDMDMGCADENMRDWQVHGVQSRQGATLKELPELTRSALRLAWTTVKNVRSNAIVFATARQTLAIAGGFTNRVDAVRRCAELYHAYLGNAGLQLAQAPFVVASDGFFPFKDSMDALFGLPVQLIIQPGGSMRDNEVLQSSAELGYPMILSGIRHFKH